MTIAITFMSGAMFGMALMGLMVASGRNRND